MNIFIIISIAIINIIFYNVNKKRTKKLEIQKDKEISDIQKLLDSKNAMLADIVHEMRSPVHGISSLSEALLRHWHQIQDEQQVKSINSIHRASSRISKLINELLDLAKFDAGKMILNFEKVNFVSVIEEVNKECMELYLFDKKVDIVFDNQIGVEAFINCDRNKISQLFVNLITNAAKFAPIGTVTIQLSVIDTEGRDYYKCSIIDEGAGITSTDLENIFEPFVRGSSILTNRVSGSGLGLAICKRIIEAHDGKIWAENNLDKGARFNFTIPVIPVLI